MCIGEKMSDKIKVFICLGTRADIIKMSPIIQELKSNNLFIPYVCLSGQHKELAVIALEGLNITIDKMFNILKPSQTLDYVLTEALRNYSIEIKKENPDVVMVHGDTTSALAGSLAAVYLNKVVYHIEAGLRTYSKTPFPEELHRRIITQCASLFACPDVISKNNLLNEGICPTQICVTGNTISDVIQKTINKNYWFSLDFLNKFPLEKFENVLITLHRRELSKEDLENVCNAILQVTHMNKNAVFFWPIHLNPRIYNVVHSKLSNKNNINLLPTLSIKDMHNLLLRCSLVLTDSAGVQEEAFLLNVPTIVLRNTTERPAFFDNSISKLISPSNFDIDVQILDSLKLQKNCSIDETIELFSNKSPVSKQIVSFMKDYLVGEQKL